MRKDVLDKVKPSGVNVLYYNKIMSFLLKPIKSDCRPNLASRKPCTRSLAISYKFEAQLNDLNISKSDFEKVAFEVIQTRALRDIIYSHLSGCLIDTPAL